jgi:cell division protein FtsN
MSDYKSFKRSPRHGSHDGSLCWGSLLLGLLLGLSVTAAVLMLELKLPDGWLPRAEAPKTPVVKEEKPAKPPVKYEFYKILPEVEVVVPDEAAKAAAKTAPAAKPGVETPAPGAHAAPAAAEDGNGAQYFIQAGSFKRDEDAERRRAEVALSGEQAHVQTISIDGGTAYRRVRLGPYKSQAAANAARDKLRAAGIETILVKARD